MHHSGNSYMQGYNSGYVDAMYTQRRDPKPGFRQSLLMPGHLDDFLKGYTQGYEIGLIHYNRQTVERGRSR